MTTTARDEQSGLDMAAQQQSPWNLLFGWTTRRISAKIILPYVVIILVVAVLATYAVTQLLASSLQDRLLNQLLDSGRKANDAMVTVEETYLAAFRAMAFTEGVDAALARGDTEYLKRALQPIQYNSRIPFVHVLDRQGRYLLGMQLKTRDIVILDPEPGIAAWPIVTKSLAREEDALGDKWSAVMPTAQGYVFYVAGPVRDQSQAVVGVVLTGSPLDNVVADLARQALAAVSLYNEEGALLATTFPYRSISEGVGIARDHAREVIAKPGQLFGRRLGIGEREYDELIGRLEIRKVATVAMGVAYPSDYIKETGSLSRNQLLVIFGSTAILVLIVGFILSGRIVRPLRRLMFATQQVMSGNLAVSVPMTTQDETGVLTQAFNEMVGGLRERERVKDTFGKYMSAEVSDYLLHSQIKLGGELREVSVLMSDIRGFTSMSEKLSPEEVVAMLNEYFEGQVAAVLSYRGRVDKYMGDAILAVFGAPLPFSDHAERAVLAAIAMREAVAVFNTRRKIEGKPPIRIGIGVNSGWVVVGNIGSEQRMEYTIIGDTVNTTQRVEDLTKEFAWDILITDTTYARVAHLVEVGEPHLVTVRGRTTEMAVYPVIGVRAERQYVIDALTGALTSNGLQEPLVQVQVPTAVGGQARS